MGRMIRKALRRIKSFFRRSLIQVRQCTIGLSTETYGYLLLAAEYSRTLIMDGKNKSSFDKTATQNEMNAEEERALMEERGVESGFSDL
jgi:hypothetical protein